MKNKRCIYEIQSPLVKMKSSIPPLSYSMHRKHRTNILLALTGLMALSLYTISLFPTQIYSQTRHEYILKNVPQNPPEVPLEESPPTKAPPTKALVVASVEADDTSWIHTHLPDWQVNRYVVNSETTQYQVPKNKGREAMVYLTYMIEAYNNLPDIVVFMHSQRYQWHNDDPLYGQYLPSRPKENLTHLQKSRWCPSSPEPTTPIRPVTRLRQPPLRLDPRLSIRIKTQPRTCKLPRTSFPHNSTSILPSIPRTLPQRNPPRSHRCSLLWPIRPHTRKNSVKTARRLYTLATMAPRHHARRRNQRPNI